MRRARERMIEVHLRGRGIRDGRVLAAMARVPRERFVPLALRDAAYADRALPLGEGQTISQPYMVAKTLELARIGPDARVLDVGTGSGYQAAILGELAAEVVSIERIPVLAERAREVLSDWANVDVVVGDGSLGWLARAPYDAIVAAAAAPRVPEPWLEQLTPEGRAVLPVGSRHVQRLSVFTRGEDPELHDACTYVPLIGDAGWGDER